jgi:PAS domain S-box-containing protein
MSRSNIRLTGVERTFDDDEIIVSKTDRKGIILYANQVFVRVSGYSEEELVGAPHSIIRHPDMPRCVFKLLWDTIEAGEEIFAYVVNLCKTGDHYWVFAHVTPSFDEAGNILGYHSSRRTPDRKAVEQIKPIYALLNETERSYSNKADGMRASTDLMLQYLDKNGMAYDQFVFSL